MHEIAAAQLAVDRHVEECQVGLSAISRRTWIDHTCFGCRGLFCPTILPLFQAMRCGRLAGKNLIGMTKLPPTAPARLGPVPTTLHSLIRVDEPHVFRAESGRWRHRSTAQLVHQERSFAPTYHR
jgi:hypothetical protein